MKVYEPKKEAALIAEVLKEIYLLRQSIKHDSGSSESYIKALDGLRRKLTSIKKLIEDEGEK
mgnify:FL=1